MIFGIRTIIEAVKSGKEIEHIFLKRGLKSELLRELSGICRELSIPVQVVPVERINRISRKNHQGAIAYISNIEYNNIEEIIPRLYEQGKTPLVLILDGITDVRNFGAICRTAECAGVDAIIFATKGSAQINADTIKTSAGSIHYIPICRTNNLKQTIAFLKNSGITVFAANEKTDTIYFDANFKNPSAVIMGSEDKGIQLEYLRICDTMIKIPLKGRIESLNVSVAAGVILYEVVRQRNIT